MRKRSSLHPVERAVIAQKWTQTAVNAEIHALIGNDSDKLVNEAGRIFYVVLGAAIESGMSPDVPDVRILRGAVNAVYDQAGEAEINETRRLSIISGLQAARRITEVVAYKALVNTACDLHLKLKTGDVHMSDFAKLTD
jgi:hypothetical protein